MRDEAMQKAKKRKERKNLIRIDQTAWPVRCDTIVGTISHVAAAPPKPVSTHGKLGVAR